MRVIVEFAPKRNIWVLWPSLILFANGSEGNYTDLTLAWICFGVSLRFGERKTIEARMELANALYKIDMLVDDQGRTAEKEAWDFIRAYIAEVQKPAHNK